VASTREKEKEKGARVHNPLLVSRAAKRARKLYRGARSKLYSHSACKSRIARAESNRTLLNFAELSTLLISAKSHPNPAATH
jgi:hypothetical protein